MEGLPIDSRNPLESELLNNNGISTSTLKVGKKSEDCVNMSEIDNSDILVLDDACDTDWESPARESDHERMEGTQIYSNIVLSLLKHLANILSRYSPYCCWTPYENFVKKPGGLVGS